MDRQLEKRRSDRAVAIGREGEISAVGELLDLLQSSSANARRLAASAADFIEEALRIQAVAAEHHCQRCSARLTPEEFARSQQTFQQEGKRLISIYPGDLPALDRLLSSKLRLFGFHP